MTDQPSRHGATLPAHSDVTQEPSSPKLLHLTLYFALAWYCLLLWLFESLTTPGAVEARGLWYVWRLCGAISMATSALDLALLTTAFALRFHPHDSQVPYLLMDADKRRLEETKPRTAILLPAHREATTPEDANALTLRIVKFIQLSPSWTDFFILFDSPNAEQPNERQVAEWILSQLTDNQRQRLHVLEYRQKPRHLQTKTGSLYYWLKKFGADFDYMVILDADSTLADEDPEQPETVDVIARLVTTLERNSDLAMVQCGTEVKEWRSAWGWMQCVNSRIAFRYQGRLMERILGKQCPCYGHNVIFRVQDFRQHVANTLCYLSHDHIDSADLTTAGRGCIHSHRVTMGESPEDSLAGYLKRDLRWARGNGQWLMYLLSKRQLPIGPWFYLVLGILHYLVPVFLSTFVVTSAVLISASHRLLSPAELTSAVILVTLIALSLILPKFIGCSSWREFFGVLLVGVFVAPMLMLYQGTLFLTGPFGTRWTVRASRNVDRTWPTARSIAALFYPAALLGAGLWTRLPTESTFDVGVFMIKFTLVMLILSPITALVVSLPIRTSSAN